MDALVAPILRNLKTESMSINLEYREKKVMWLVARLLNIDWDFD